MSILLNPTYVLLIVLAAAVLAMSAVVGFAWYVERESSKGGRNGD